LILLQAFFSWFNSAAVIGLWLVDEYNPPLIRALVQAFILLPANAAVGFFLGQFLFAFWVMSLNTLF
jgi:hypothetical protein